MRPILFHTPAVPVAMTSSSSLSAAYPASNVLHPSINKPWVSNGLAFATPEYVQFEFGVGNNIQIAGVFVQHATFSAMRVLRGTTSTPSTQVGGIFSASGMPTDAYVATDWSVPAGIDRHGIYHGRFLNRDAGGKPIYPYSSGRYWRIENNTAPLTLFDWPYGDNAHRVRENYQDNYEIGAVYLFQSYEELAEKPLVGSRVTYNYPDNVVELPNGQPVLTSMGAPYAEIELDFIVARAGQVPNNFGISLEGWDDLESVARRARRSTCWLDLGIKDKPWLSWPVRFVETRHERRMRAAGGAQDVVTLKFREVT